MTQKLHINQTFVLIKCKTPISDYFDALLLFGYTRVCEVVAESQTPSLVYLIGIHHVWNIEIDMHDGCKIRLDCYYPWSHFSNVDNKLVCWLSIAKKTWEKPLFLPNKKNNPIVKSDKCNQRLYTMAEMTPI